MWIEGAYYLIQPWFKLIKKDEELVGTEPAMSQDDTRKVVMWMLFVKCTICILGNIDSGVQIFNNY